MKKFNRVIAVVIILAVIFGCLSGASLAADKYDEYPIAENNSLKGKIIFLDAGHGKGNTNGVGSYLEHEGNLNFALLVKANLERCGATVIMTRPDEIDVDSYERMANVNLITLREIQKEYTKKLEITFDDTERAKLQANIDELTELMAIMQSVIDDPEISPRYFNSPWNINTKISRELKRIFEYEACEYVQKNMLLLSIHANAIPGGGASGTETYYLNNTFSDNVKYYTEYAFVDQSKAFAQMIQDEVVTAGSFRDRGIMINNFFMLRETNMPAALLEVGYYTSSSDRAKLMGETYQKRISAGITYAILDYFEIYGPYESVPGDVNMDGMITNADVICVARHLVDIIMDIDLLAADLDGDGIVNNIDLIKIARMVVD